MFSGNEVMCFEIYTLYDECVVAIMALSRIDTCTGTLEEIGMAANVLRATKYGLFNERELTVRIHAMHGMDIYAAEQSCVILWTCGSICLAHFILLYVFL